MRAFFEDVVLVLNFNEASQVDGCYDFWASIYERLFHAVVGVAGGLSPRPEVLSVWMEARE